MMWLWQPLSLLSVAVAIANTLPQPTEVAIQDLPVAVDGKTITCPSMFTPVGDQCLYFGAFMKTDHKGSAQICSTVGSESKLVAIRTATQLQKIDKKIRDMGYDSLGFWIDGTTDGGEFWNFTSGEPLPMGTPFWAASETIKYPKNGTNLNCAAITHESGFYIENVDCTASLSPLCEADPLSVDLTGDDTDTDEEIDSSAITCPPFYVNLEGTPICTAFVIWADVSWSDARQVCLGLQGDMFTALNIEWYRQIYEYLHKEGIDTFSFWIGGKKEADKWIWNDGVPVPTGAPFWGLSNDTSVILEPDGTDENCLAMTSEGAHYFRDKQCSEHYSPMCVAMPQNP